MPADIPRILSQGGRPLIDLLEYVVLTVDMDFLFLFLVDEYRVAPTTERALALYDCCCAPGAPATISAREALPPKDFRLAQAVDRYRRDRERLRELQDESPAREQVPAGEQAIPFTPGLMLLPPRYLFDALAELLRRGQPNPLERVAERYDPQLGPLENLPGGKLNASQKFFVEFVWRPKVRPRLVASGFRRIANVA